MNIVVRTSAGKYIVRPDTTWERDSEDFFPPEFVSALGFTPVLVARVCKPGRSVGEKFAPRYFDQLGFGVLLYPTDMLDGSAEGFACASCLDHTSFFTAPSLPQGSEMPAFTVCRRGEPALFELPEGFDAVPAICKAIAEATKYIYIRIGDYIAIELNEIMPIAARKDGTAVVDAAGETFRIVF